MPNSRPVPEWMRKFAWFLDDSIPIPGTNGRRHTGVDGIIATFVIVWLVSRIF